ncbi:UDP-N-acetylmuramoyl-L-alanyl-D-glutamate--2,6-diaminopimelate ligase [Acidithiobacillus sp. AMEEHan]|uniref:UDP-N-acetylmuramoyl-L-alanyl-D-glutamate--2, 6-diaminopimelate ligase n=1 Tax=Acidithiobacillus sp. AMEEHan TaxID=2994951 RepID=UPI0027E3BE95|nr:UDP-N-acetylmuramoyl-L-alanyl-D-glutamate--2,6-diaminopimelate ligase [Acidithiobacillus sp. AMEEHan]
MSNIDTLDQLLPELQPARAIPITGIDSDSRRLRDGGLFVALNTRHGSAAHFLPDAWQAGAVAAIVEAEQEGFTATDAGPVWSRPDARALLGLALRRHHRWDADASPQLIGVTGTNGKSSVTRLIAQLAPAPAQIIGTLGHGPVDALQALPNTTPEAVELWRLLVAARAAGAQTVSMEVSSHALALGRVAAVPFHVAVFTNLTQDHLDFHGDMASYGAAKAQLFQMPELQYAILNANDPFTEQLRQKIAARVEILDYGFGAGAIAVRDYHPGASGTLLELDTPQGRRRLRSPLLGRSNTYNLLAALACATALGWELDDEQIARLDLPAGRYQCLPAVPGKGRVMIDYAHTPDALDAVLQDLRAIAKGKITVVFGCGGDRDRGKRSQMGAIAARLADRVIVTDDNPRREDPEQITTEILAGIPAGRAVVEHDRARAIRLAIAEAQPGDWVLIAGKGHESYQDRGGQKQPFADAQHAEEALRQ